MRLHLILSPGFVLSFLGLELRNLFNAVGNSLLPLSQSEGGTVLFENCVLHRRADLPPTKAVSTMMSTARPAGIPGSQLCFVTTNLSYNSTSSSESLTGREAVSVVDFATYVQPDSGSSIQIGGYLVHVVQSYDVADQYVSEQCLKQGTVSGCVAQLPLRQAEGGGSGGSTQGQAPKVIAAAMGSVTFAALVAAAVAILFVYQQRRRHRRHSSLSVSLSAPQPSTTAATDPDAAATPSTAAAAGTAVPFRDINDDKSAYACNQALIQQQQQPQQHQHQQRQRQRLHRRSGDIEAPPVVFGPSSSSFTCSSPATAATPSADVTAITARTGAVPLAAASASDDAGYGFHGLASQEGAWRLSGWSLLASDLGLPAYRRRPTNPGTSGPAAATTAVGTSTATSLMSSSLPFPDANDSGDSSTLADFTALPRGLTCDYDDAGSHSGTGTAAAAAAGGRSWRDWQAGIKRSAPVEDVAVSAAVPCGGGGAIAAVSATAAAWAAAVRRGRGNVATVSGGGNGDGDADEDGDGGEGGGGGGAHHIEGSSVAVWGMCRPEGRSQRRSFQEAQLHLDVVLGCGSYGTVYKGTWQGLPVAVKTLVFSASDESRRRALQEAALCARMSHPNVVATYEVKVESVPRAGGGGGGGGGMPFSPNGVITTTAAAAAAMAAQAASVIGAPGGGYDCGPTSDDDHRRGPGGGGRSGSGGRGSGNDGDGGARDDPPGRGSGGVVGVGDAGGDGGLRRGDGGSGVGCGHGHCPGASRAGGGGGGGGGSGGGGGVAAVVMDWRLYIVQEYADAGPLWDLYGNEDLWPDSRQPHLPAVVGLALGIARALAHLHAKRIIHGDFNPSNVLLKRDPGEPSGYAIKVGDFGLSVTLPQNHSHLNNLRMGTVFYVCPTVVLKAQVGPASDVFSLGVMLWELYHGRPAGIRTDQGPRYSSVFPAFPPSCPEPYRAVALHCLQRQPQNRPSAAAVVEQLERLLAACGPRPQESPRGDPPPAVLRTQLMGPALRQREEAGWHQPTEAGGGRLAGAATGQHQSEHIGVTAEASLVAATGPGEAG